MKRIGNIDYPDTIYTIMADPALAPVWVEYCQVTKLMDSHEYLMAMRQPIEPRALYNKFISYDGDYPVNVGSTTRLIANQLAADNEWGSPYWNSIFSSLRNELLTLVNAERMSKFWKHDVFLDHHVNVNQGNADDASTDVIDPQLSSGGRAAVVLGLEASPILTRAMENFEKEGETLRTLSLLQDYLKKQNSTLRAQDVIKILIANGALSAPEESTAYKIAEELQTTDMRLIERFYADFKRVRGDGHALWNLLNALIQAMGKGGTPHLILRRLDRRNLLPPHADALAPGEDYDVPPSTSGDDDLPPPPPPLEGEDQDAEAIDVDDLPPPPSFGNVADYPHHIALIEQLLPGGDKAKLTKAFADLRAEMIANDDCPGDIGVNTIASEVVTLVKNKRRAEAAADAADPFPAAPADADPFPTRGADPFPDDVAQPDNEFPDTGPMGVDFNGLVDEDAAAADEDDDPFPGGSDGGQPRPPRGPDPFPDADDAPSESGAGRDGSGSSGGGHNRDAPLRGGGGAKASSKQLKQYLQREVTNIAGMLDKGNNAGAKDHAITVSRNMAKLGGPDAELSAKSILSAAIKQTNKPSPSDVSAIDGHIEDDADAGSVSGQTELSNADANKADWAGFAKHYMLGDEDVATSKQIALSIAKNGIEAPKAIAAAKTLAQKINKDKKAKFKFKNYRHVLAAVFQLMKLKTEKQKLLKALKPSEMADVVAIPEDA